MTAPLPGAIAALLYLLAAAAQLGVLQGRLSIPRSWPIAAGLIAVLLHLVAVSLQMGTPAGVDLGIYHMGSATLAVVAAIAVASSTRNAAENLFIGLFPLATLALAASLLLESPYDPHPLATGIVAHVLLSVIAYSMLATAALQGVLLALQDRMLRRHDLSVLRRLPPLQAMERLLFEFLGSGMVFLTSSIITGFVFLDDFSVGGLIHHTVITCAAWIVFAILIWGRYRLGWRGAIASRWTLSGFALLLTGYFGSKMVMELILCPQV